MVIIKTGSRAAGVSRKIWATALVVLGDGGQLVLAGLFQQFLVLDGLGLNKAVGHGAALAIIEGEGPLGLRAVLINGQ